MSTPRNILGQFRSYAYHHILLVCNNSIAAEELANTSEIVVFQQPSDRSRYASRQTGNSAENRYITLIDGMTSARFYITGATWENIIAMENFVGAGNIPQSTSMSLNGELDIMEPLGANFLNVLTDACDDLDTDPVGLVFVLKTVFVGHTTQGTTEMISNIRPLLFINYDISAVFDASGAKYKMGFVGATNGMGKLPQTQQIFKGFSFKIGQSDSLAETFTSLATKINTSYSAFLEQAQIDFAQTLYDASVREGNPLTAQESADNATKFFDANYRPVEYRIFAPDYTDGAVYSAGDNENIRVSNNTADGAFNFGPKVGVEEIIKRIMASCSGVINDSKGREDGTKYIYKITSGLNSSSTQFIVEYHVNRYAMSMLPYEAAFNGAVFEPLPGESITFDYIFTGNNVDIKSFDIKMEMGMAFFQIAATTDTIPTQHTTKEGNRSRQVKTTGSSVVASNGQTRRSATPLFLGSKIEQPMARNTRNPIDSASFQALLNRHAALETLEAKMVIYGNPQLLNEMQVLPSELNRQETEPARDGQTINPSWLNTPTLVKINIKMPVDTNDVNTEYRDFWYTGFYTLFGVKQIFNDGEFTQELDLMSLPVSDKLEQHTDTPSEVIVDKEQNRTEVHREITGLFSLTDSGNVKDSETVVVADVKKNTVRWPVAGR